MTTMTWSDLISGAGYLLIFLGFVFSIIPVLPGSLMVYAGMLVYGASTQFKGLGVGPLVILGVIAVLAWASEWALNAFTMKRAGATWKTIGGAIIGGLVGAAALSLPVPIIGTVFGAVAGTMLGVFIVEMVLKGQAAPALKTSGAYLAGCLVARIIELTFCFIMLGIFLFARAA
jgi:uncharacterized protein